MDAQATRRTRKSTTHLSKAPVLQLMPSVQPLSSNCRDVVEALSAERQRAQTEAICGAIVVTFNGRTWSARVAGSLSGDTKNLCAIAGAMLGQFAALR